MIVANGFLQTHGYSNSGTVICLDGTGCQKITINVSFDECGHPTGPCPLGIYEFPKAEKLDRLDEREPSNDVTPPDVAPLAPVARGVIERLRRFQRRTRGAFK